MKLITIDGSCYAPRTGVSFQVDRTKRSTANLNENPGICGQTSRAIDSRPSSFDWTRAKKNLNLTTLTRVSIYVYRPRLAALTLGHLAADHVGIYRWGPEYWVGTASHKILMWQTQSMICPLYGAILFYLRPNGPIEWNGCRAVNVNLKVHIFRKLQFR